MTEAADPNEAAEQLALVLASHGLQRMTARVLAALLFTEQPTMTMGELADRLQASSGAISGAIKMLTSVGLAERVPAPASRRDHYRLRDDAWALLFTNQNAVISAMLAAAETGIAATGHGSPAGRRLTRMRDFYAFLLAKSRRCSTAGINSRCPRREAPNPALVRSVPSQLGEHSAQFGVQVATAGPVHRPGTVGQQQAQPRDTARAHRARTKQAQHDLVDQTHRGRDA